MEKRFLQDICILTEGEAEEGMPSWANLIGKKRCAVGDDQLAGGGVYACFWDDELIYIGSFVGPDGDPFGGNVADRIHKHVLGFTLRAKKLGFTRGPLQSIIHNLQNEENQQHAIARDLQEARSVNDRLERGSIQATYKKAWFAALHWDELKKADPKDLTERFTFAYRRVVAPEGLKPSKSTVKEFWIKPLEKTLIQQFEPICNTEFRAGPDGPPAKLPEVADAFEEVFARPLPAINQTPAADPITPQAQAPQGPADIEKDTVFPSDARWEEYTIQNGEVRIRSLVDGPSYGRTLLLRRTTNRVYCLSSVGRLEQQGFEARSITAGPMQSSVFVDFSAEQGELDRRLSTIIETCLAELNETDAYAA